MASILDEAIDLPYNVEMRDHLYEWKDSQGKRGSMLAQKAFDLNDTRTSKILGVKSDAQRYIVVLNVGGRRQPFYLSSGAGGKVEKGVKVGQWYPFFGTDDNGWFIKGKAEDLAGYYGNDDLKKAAQRLDSEIGDLFDPKQAEALGKKGIQVPRSIISDVTGGVLNIDQPRIQREYGLNAVNKFLKDTFKYDAAAADMRRTMAATAGIDPNTLLPDDINPNKGVALSEIIERGPYTPPTPPPPPETLIERSPNTPPSTPAPREVLEQKMPNKTPALSSVNIGRIADWGENITGGTFTRGGALGTAGVSLGLGGYKSFSEQMDAYKNQNPLIRDEDPWYPNARDFDAFGYAASKPETYYNTGVYTKDNIQESFGNPAKILERGDTWTQRLFGPEQVDENPVMAATALIESTGRGLYNQGEELITEDIPWLAMEGIPYAAKATWGVAENIGRRTQEYFAPTPEQKEAQQRIEQIDNDAKYMH